MPLTTISKANACIQHEPTKCIFAHPLLLNSVKTPLFAVRNPFLPPKQLLLLLLVVVVVVVVVVHLDFLMTSMIRKFCRRSYRRNDQGHLWPWWIFPVIAPCGICILHCPRPVGSCDLCILIFGGSFSNWFLSVVEVPVWMWPYRGWWWSCNACSCGLFMLIFCWCFVGGSC